MFAVHRTPEYFDKARDTGHFGVVFEEHNREGNCMIMAKSPFLKAPFSKCFRSSLKPKAAIFKFLWFEERLRQAPFSWRVGVGLKCRACVSKYLRRSVDWAYLCKFRKTVMRICWFSSQYGSHVNVKIVWKMFDTFSVFSDKFSDVFRT